MGDRDTILENIRYLTVVSKHRKELFYFNYRITSFILRKSRYQPLALWGFPATVKFSHDRGCHLVPELVKDMEIHV